MKSTVLDDARAVGARDAFDADDGAELIEFTPAQLTAFLERIEMRARERHAQICARLAAEWDSDAVVIDKNYAAACTDAIRNPSPDHPAAAGEQTK